MRKQQLKKQRQSKSSGEDPSPDPLTSSGHGPHEEHGPERSSLVPIDSTIETRTLCIIGLGNPGSEYEHTRHNVGFWLLDRLATRLQLRFRRKLFSHYALATIESSQLREKVGDVLIDSHDDVQFNRLVLVKPMTFMNRSGKVIPHILRKFGHRIQFVVATDQLDLEPGAVRVKKRGGTAGHNGLKSVTAYLERDFWPLYIGIGRPRGESDVISHVLGVPESDERELLDESIERLSGWVLKLPFEELDSVISLLNSKARTGGNARV